MGFGTMNKGEKMNQNHNVATVEGDMAVWPGEWEKEDIDVFFLPDAFSAIRQVAGCEDWELRARLRKEEYVVVRRYPPNFSGVVLENVLMCDPVSRIFFYVRISRGWCHDGAPQLVVHAIWPALERIIVSRRRRAAQLAMTPRQYAKWLEEGEITMRDLPRLHKWFARWCDQPDHFVLMEDLCVRRDRIEVTIENANGDALMIGFLPKTLRKINRARLVKQEVFWSWVDARLKDMRDRGFIGDRGLPDMAIEDVQRIRARNVRGLPRPDGTHSEPILDFLLWNRH
jgi:hypothetical protein